MALHGALSQWLVFLGGCACMRNMRCPLNASVQQSREPGKFSNDYINRHPQTIYQLQTPVLVENAMVT